jgi:hypothetical protein
MNIVKTSLFCIATLAAATAFQAQAGVNAVDVPRISNGGTGFIGVTASAPMARSSALGYKSASMGEAGTSNGQPNVNPEAPMASASTRVMGNSGMQHRGSTQQARDAAWGTPD